MIDNLSEFFKAIAEPNRQRIINLLLHHSALHVNEISEILGLPQSKVSRHLMVLRNTRWLVFHRRDKWIYYKINPDLEQSIGDFFKKIFSGYLNFESDLKKAANKM